MKMVWYKNLVVAAALALAPVVVVLAGDDKPDWNKGFTEVAKKAIPAVVFLRVEKSVATGYHQSPHGYFGDEFMRRFFGERYQMPPQQEEYKQSGQGSGFIISKDGFILTNSHVAGDVDKILVTLHDGRELEAKLIGTDPRSEVAVIKIESAEDLPFLSLGRSAELEIGEWVVAVGNPFGLSATLTAGVVSAKGRSNIGIADYENFIQTDAAINPGNSGGPLININGEVVGINTAIFSRSGGYMGIGFAIPIDMAGKIKDQLMEKGKVDRGYIGIVIQDMNKELANSFGLEKAEGIIIAQVAPNSAGEKAGLKSGDIILQLGGKKVESVSKFRNEVAANTPGTELNLVIFRDNKEKKVKLKIGSLEELEQAMGRAPSQPDERETFKGESLGIEVEDLNPELAREFGYEDLEGVVITKVEAGSVAAEAGLQPGILIMSVNRNPVSNLREFRGAMRDAGDARRVLLLVTDGQSSRFLALPIK